jgi:hypothetical protein
MHRSIIRMWRSHNETLRVPWPRSQPDRDGSRVVVVELWWGADPDASASDPSVLMPGFRIHRERGCARLGRRKGEA